MTRDFKMGRLSWIFQVGPRCHHKCSPKGKAEEDLPTEGTRQCDHQCQDAAGHEPKNARSTALIARKGEESTRKGALPTA